MKRPRSHFAMTPLASTLSGSRLTKLPSPEFGVGSGTINGLPKLNLKAPIRLSTLEENLFSLLLNVVKQPGVPPVTLRVAGGWVRDKLLYPSRELGADVDIDIALDTVLGNVFAQLIQDYLVSCGEKTGSIGVIQKNPDQSKHLETAAMRVLGVNLDIVNLRTETYSHDSRIPDVEIGTPSEDALRRDFTINALFYNINECSLEDFTRRGFDDIRARIIRTPLPPLTTLLDDPLRALRAIRFAARLGFSIDDELARACKDSSVHEALFAKVSRERVLGELHRILCNENAPHAIALLVEFGLFPVILRMPPSSAMVSQQVIPSDIPLLSLSALLNLSSLPHFVSTTIPVELVRYAALLSPVAALRCKCAENGKRPKEMEVAQYVLRLELRMSSSDVKRICNILKGALMFKAIVHHGADTLDRLEIVRVVRIVQADWRVSLAIALVMELPVVHPSESFARVFGWGGRVGLGKECMIIVEIYNQFQRKLDNLNLEGVWDLQPLVDGKELVEVLPRLKRGPQMGVIMKQQIDWMVNNPSKGKEDVLRWLRSSFPDLA